MVVKCFAKEQLEPLLGFELTHETRRPHKSDALTTSPCHPSDVIV